jgi:succinate dehydrogenase / fumarate reductase cytochrome b subunit
MNLLTRIWRSSLGRKYLMALSGVALFLFLIGHMVGNLMIFLGRDGINGYAAFLHGVTEVLWAVRLGLLAMVVLHVVSAISLSLENKAARPVPYERLDPVVASYASRTMLMSGLIVASFVIYHLLHFTGRVPTVNLTGVDFDSLHESLRNGTQRPDVYAMVVLGFSKPLVTLFYLLGMGLLCLHLSHGASAMFQSLGLKTDAYRSMLDKFAIAVSVILFVGFSAVPISVLLGLVK